MRPHVSSSDRTPSPGHACAACRKRPSHADGEIALRCRPRTPPSPQLGGEAASIQIIVCEGGIEWLRRGESAAYLPNSDGHPMANTKRQRSSIRRSRTLPSLRGGSQHRSGRTHICIARIARQVRSAHAPLAAKGRPMRTPKWRFGVGQVRQQPRSLAERQHPSRSSHERPDPIAHCGRPSKRERVGPTPARHTRQRTHRFIGVKPDLAHALRSGCRHLSPFAPVGRARIARQAWAAHRWAIGIRVLRSTNVNGMCVGPC
jgi:hypothetical protein